RDFDGLIVRGEFKAQPVPVDGDPQTTGTCGKTEQDSQFLRGWLLLLECGGSAPLWLFLHAARSCSPKMPPKRLADAALHKTQASPTDSQYTSVHFSRSRSV